MDELDKLLENVDIFFVRQREQKGLGNAVSYAEAFIGGENFALLLGDIITLPNCTEKLLKIYNDKWSFVCSDMLVISKMGTRISTGDKIITYENALWKNIIGNQILIKKNRILGIGGFDESLPNAQDYDMWLRLLKKFGPALRYNKAPLYILHTEDDIPRIGYNKNRLRGHLRVYNKNKSAMSKEQRLYNLLLFRKEQKKDIYLRYVIALFGTKYFKEQLIFFLKRKIKNMIVKG